MMLRTALLFIIVLFTLVPASAQSQDAIQQMLSNFDRIDADGNGVLSRAEYRKVQLARWKQIDRNSDGYLTEVDFPPFAASRVKTQLALISDFDADGDSLISQSEFVNGTGTCPSSEFLGQIAA